MEFDGKEDARLDIDPRHVHRDDDARLDSVDHLLLKRPRIAPAVPDMFNAFGDFVRERGAKIFSECDFHGLFFKWAAGNRPEVLQKYVEYEEAVRKPRANVGSSRKVDR